MSEFTERLRDEDYAGPMQHLRSHVEIDALFNQAADIIDEMERALREARVYVPEHHGPIVHKVESALNKLERAGS